MSRTTYAPKQTYTGTGSLDTYTFDFKITDKSQLLVIEVNDSGVETQRVRGTDTVYLSSVTFDAVDGGGTVVLAANLTSAYNLILLLADDAPTQDFEFRNKTSFTLRAFENALDALSGAIQRLTYRGKQALRIHDLDDEDTFNAQLPPGAATSANRSIVVNSAGDGMDYGPSTDEIANAQGYAQAASDSADEAEEWATKTDGIVESTEYSSKAWAIGGTDVTETSARGAAKEWATKTDNPVDTSEYSAKEYAQGIQTRGAVGGGSAKDWANYTGGTVDDTEYSAKKYSQDAAASASAAALAAASAQWSDVVYVTNADSPVAISDSDAGKLYAVDSSGGAVVFNLPAISGLTLSNPWVLGIKKTSSDSNNVTINRNGTDTIDGDTSVTISRENAARTFVPDADATPDDWTTLEFGEVPVSGALVGDTDVQDLSNKTFIDGITLEELSSTPSNPASGDKKLYAKNDGKLYTLDSAGNEVEAGAGGGGNLDNFYSEDFSSTSVSDFTSGNDAIFDNGGVLGGTLADEEVSPLNGSRSFKYTLGLGSSNDWVKSPAIPLEIKQQSQTVGLTFWYTYDGDDDDITVVAYDDTNSEVLTLATDFIKATSVAKPFSVSFPINSNTANLHWGLQTNASTLGAELIIDDVQITTSPFVYKNLLKPEIYVHGEGNSGGALTANVTDIDFTEVEDDENTWNGTTFTAPYPLEVVVDGQTRMTSSTQYNIVAYINGSSESPAGQYGITDQYKRFRGIYKLDTGDTLSFRCDQSLTLNSSTETFITIRAFAKSSENVVAYNSKNAINSIIKVHTGNGHGSTNTKIRRFSTTERSEGSAITYTDSAANGAEFEIKKDGFFHISYTDRPDASAQHIFGISRNSSTLTTNVDALTGPEVLAIGTCGNEAGEAIQSVSWAGPLSKGDIIRPHTNAGANATNAQVTFTISEIGVGDLLGVPKPLVGYVKDVKSTGTSGGTFTSGAWRTRDLNTTEGDFSKFGSLSSNQFTLSPGKYLTEVEAPARKVDRHKAKIRDITNSSDSIIGKTAYSINSDDDITDSIIKGELLLTESTTFEVQHQCQTTFATSGFGLSGGFSVDEVYTQVKITKLA